MADDSEPDNSEPHPSHQPGSDKEGAIDRTDSGEEKQLRDEAENARADADLTQQRRMAVAAEDQVRLTRLQYERSLTEIWFNGASAIIGALAAVFAGTAALVSWCGIRDARAHSERELRAYIHPDSVKILNFSDTTPYRVTVEIRNFGQTPAYNVTFGFSTALLSPLYQHIDILENIPGIKGLKLVDGLAIGTLGPSQRFSMPLGRGGAPKPLHAYLIREDMLEAFVYGFIDYKDAFGARRRTTFQHRTVKFKNISPMEPLNTLVCPEGNHAT